jgi:mannose-6-phosphate isomerase-like protein (cupin superfamily)
MRNISREAAPASPAAWVHAVDIDGAKLHYHKRSAELYYVLEGGYEFGHESIGTGLRC